MVSEADPLDKRQFTLSLTEEGVALHVKGSRISRRRQRQLEAEFTESEYRTLGKLLDRLYKAADRLG